MWHLCFIHDPGNSPVDNRLLYNSCTSISRNFKVLKMSCLYREAIANRMEGKKVKWKCKNQEINYLNRNWHDTSIFYEVYGLIKYSNSHRTHQRCLWIEETQTIINKEKTWLKMKTRISKWIDREIESEKGAISLNFNLFRWLRQYICDKYFRTTDAICVQIKCRFDLQYWL